MSLWANFVLLGSLGTQLPLVSSLCLKVIGRGCKAQLSAGVTGGPGVSCEMGRAGLPILRCALSPVSFLKHAPVLVGLYHLSLSLFFF